MPRFWSNVSVRSGPPSSPLDDGRSIAVIAVFHGQVTAVDDIICAVFHRLMTDDGGHGLRRFPPIGDGRCIRVTTAPNHLVAVGDIELSSVKLASQWTDYQQVQPARAHTRATVLRLISS